MVKRAVCFSSRKHPVMRLPFTGEQETFQSGRLRLDYGKASNTHRRWCPSWNWLCDYSNQQSQAGCWSSQRPSGVWHTKHERTVIKEKFGLDVMTSRRYAQQRQRLNAKLLQAPRWRSHLQKNGSDEGGGARRKAASNPSVNQRLLDGRWLSASRKYPEIWLFWDTDLRHAFM